MDVEAKKGGSGNRKRRNICIGLGVTLILLIVLMVILAFTVFKAKDPVITVDAVALDDLKVRLDMARVTVNLNLTVSVNLTVENPNKVGMKYKDSAALLIYRGEEVGEVPIPAGKVSGDETVHMVVFLTVMTDRFASNRQIFSDMVAGSLPLSTNTKISGKVSIFKMFKGMAVVVQSEFVFEITQILFYAAAAAKFDTQLKSISSKNQQNNPRLKFNQAKVEGIAPRLTLPTLNFQLNLTLDLQILVENPNHASFRHGTGNSILMYGGDQVGEADIYPGLIPSAGSTTLPCRLTVQVDKIASDITTLIGDITGGQVVMETHTKIPGRINFLGIFKKHVVTSSDCKFTIGFPAMNITNQECKNKL
ncbi:hypothetical protein Patl1_31626 [Pistacia atlantica]|uniref:Uncharacterized protein n=1 Tax=Pistacia atlantica TaxID=434234 RepID=A0ACC1AQA4_9ROSI|nr:hypothetical protein Patl1_31626 [Pistacia atlantica]